MPYVLSNHRSCHSISGGSHEISRAPQGTAPRCLFHLRVLFHEPDPGHALQYLDQFRWTPSRRRTHKQVHVVRHHRLLHDLEPVPFGGPFKYPFERTRYRFIQNRSAKLRDPNNMVFKLVHGVARSSVFHAKYCITFCSGSSGGLLLRTRKGCGIRQRTAEMMVKQSGIPSSEQPPISAPLKTMK